MPVLPSFNLSDIITILTVIRITNETGTVLPFVCERNTKTFAFEAPLHPVDSNLNISDTLWTVPRRITLEGVVPAKSWNTFEQIITGESLGAGKLGVLESIGSNIMGAKAGAKAGGLGLYTITTLSGIYKDMALLSAEFEESADMNTAYKGTLTFQECPQVSASSSDFSEDKMKNAADSNATETGQQAAKKVDNGKSLAKNLSDFLKGI